MFGKPVAAGVWQTGKSGPTNGCDTSMAVALAPATVKTLPVSSVSSAAPPPSAAAPAETSSLCDRVNVAMSSSKIGQRKKSESEIQRVALGRDQKKNRELPSILTLSGDNCNVCTLRQIGPEAARLSYRRARPTSGDRDAAHCRCAGEREGAALDQPPQS
jgi:hypothetical protein